MADVEIQRLLIAFPDGRIPMERGIRREDGSGLLSLPVTDVKVNATGQVLAAVYVPDADRA